MAALSLDLDRTREMLCERIVEVLRSWPETDRRIFVLSHYKGESLDDISYSLGLEPYEIRLILDHCERRLRSALKAFRTGSLEEETASPSDSVRFVTNSCFRC